MKQIIRHTPSLFWNFIEQGAHTGVSRLILFPIVAHLVEKKDFGFFATVLSFTLIIGVNPANGLAIGLLRNLSNFNASQQERLSSTAVQMCHRFLTYFLAGVLVLLVGAIVFGLIDTRTFLCMSFLTISLYAENEFMLILTPLRYKRLFREHSLWFVTSSLCLLAFGVLGAYWAGVVGLAFGMMLANFVMLGLAAKRHFNTGLGYDIEQARSLRWVWIHMTIAGMLVLAGPHLNRIVLRMYWDNEAVADLFAATGIAHVFVMPISNSSRLLLGMISRYNTVRQVSAYVYKLLLGMMVGGSIGGMVLFAVAAPFMLKILFPGFGDRALDLLSILIWMIPANVVIAFVRPLITKFAPVAWIPRLNFAVLAVMLILMFALIPRWGLEGAAWSIAIGSILAALLRTVIFCVIYVRAKALPDNREVLQVDPDNELT